MTNKIKIDCPINFLDKKELEMLIANNDFVISSDPECLIVNPGCDFYYDEKYFKNFKNLKVVGSPSTGINHLDLKYLSNRNIQAKCLLNDRDSLESITASAEFTWTHIMNAVRKFNIAANNISKWRSDENESYLRSNELCGKTIGIIGLGRIGRKIAKYACAFSMNVVFYDPYVSYPRYKKLLNLKKLDKCDIISINCYLTEETEGLISYDVFDGFKKDLIVVNTSRGEVVNEDYIYDLITNEKIIYGCDVLQNEQNISLLKKSKLFNLKSDRLTITPHVAGATKESQTKALESILRTCKECIK